MRHLLIPITICSLLLLSDCNKDECIPSAPQLISPLNGSVNTDLNLTFDWERSKYSDSYGFQLSFTADFTEPEVNVTGIETLSFGMNNLELSKKYYWRVNARNSLGVSPWSEVWSFTTSEVPTTGLIAWYPFNGNANDESGNANHGTVNGATLTSDRFSRADNAYYFNGTNNISVKSKDQLNLIGDMSVSLWFYSEGPPQFRTNHS